MIWNPFKHRHQDHDLSAEELAELRRIERTDKRIEADLDMLVAAELHLPIRFAINQIATSTVTGESHMSTGPVLPQILGITLGNVGTFNTIVTAPAGAIFPAGVQFAWSSSDPLTTLTPSADTTTVAIATTTSDTAASFALTCGATFTAPGATSPTTLTATATVPLNAPVSTVPSAFSINQVS
jgi:hypothetical protein